MMPAKALALPLALALAGCAMTSEPPAAPTPPDRLLTWPQLLERPRPEPSRTVRYGPHEAQFVDLWLPEGAGPHPVVLMVHGGCWLAEWDRTLMNWIAEDLRGHGIAVWNIEYRRLGQEGGGYPGTFLDAAAAADALRDQAACHDLDITRLVATGHSAGGHLALWIAARHRLPENSPLRSADPIPVHAVVSLGGLQDLEEAARPPGSGCGAEVIARLIGDAGPGRSDVFADTSVPRLAPLGVPQVLVNGAEDRIIPPFYAEAYARQMQAAGDEVRVRMIERTGHVELVAPESAAWAAAREEIMKALGR